MTNRFTKLATIALVTLTASAPFAMASTAAVGNAVIGTPVVVAPLAAQPDMPYLVTRTADLDGVSNTVKVAQFEGDPQMPTFGQTHASGNLGSMVVTSGSVSANPLVGR